MSRSSDANNMKQKSNFLSTLSYYDKASLNALLILTQKLFEEDGEKEEYVGIKRLFARICCTFRHPSGVHELDFRNENEVGLIVNSLIPFLFERYQAGMKSLASYVESGDITTNQFLYELAFPKTYARVFIENISDKLAPFHESLLKYGTTETAIAEGLGRMFEHLITPKSKGDIISPENSNIGTYIEPTFVKELIDANEQTEDLESISAFSKEVFFPVCRTHDLFYLLSPETLIDQFYKCVHRFFMKRSCQPERDSLMKAKGQNFNHMCANLFRFGFGFNGVYENVTYPGGEIDVLVLEKDCLFIIECKSRNYTDKLSGPSQSYINANQSNLDHAFHQINHCLEYLNNGHLICISNGGSPNRRLGIADYHYVIPLVINLDNLAELNADYASRQTGCVYTSYDDLTIIRDVINRRKWLLVDFMSQILAYSNRDSAADDIIDMFAFYCQCKNMEILYQENLNVVINELGNDYFEPYFSFSTERNPIFSFDTDIASFSMLPSETYHKCITRYHQNHWETIASIASKNGFVIGADRKGKGSI